MCPLRRYADAVEIPTVFEEDLVADDSGGGVEFVVEPVGRQDIELTAVADYLGGAPVADEVDSAVRSHGRGVDAADALQALGEEMRLAGPRVVA